jgi:hypothetical protein
LQNKDESNPHATISVPPSELKALRAQTKRAPKGVWIALPAVLVLAIGIGGVTAFRGSRVEAKQEPAVASASVAPAVLVAASADVSFDPSTPAPASAVVSVSATAVVSAPAPVAIAARPQSAASHKPLMVQPMVIPVHSAPKPKPRR